MRHADATLHLSHEGESIRRAAASLGDVALIVYHRDGTEIVALGPGTSVVVGRAEPADVVVCDSSLSRQHARFTREDGQVRVEDLGSTNGTWIAGEFAAQALVRPGTEVMLGTVAIAIHARSPTLAPYLGLDGHDTFAATLRDEVARARYFARSTAVLMVRTREARAEATESDTGARYAELHRWAPRLHALVRPVDRLALYGPDVLEILMPEATVADAERLAATITSDPDLRGAALRCGLGGFPESATTADSLLQACREAVCDATAARPIRIAPAAATTLLPGGGPNGAGRPRPVAKSAPMIELLEMARRLGRGVIPVLLHGETGSGKEIVARFIHEHGPRAHQPMVSVNCAAIPAGLVESTLFGHERGAFTGATQRHAGVFEAAHGGTVLLDEVGELPAPAQAALLRVLETKAVVRVGSTQEVPVDARILAASHRDLEAMSERGEFRKDLYYRLNALTLEIPPLRDRPEDVAPLAELFLRLGNGANRRSVRRIEPDALAALARYSWPGNVRELRNAIERAVVIAEHDVVTLADLPPAVRALDEVVALSDSDEGPAPPDGSFDAARVPPTAATAIRRPGEDLRACMERLESEVLLEALAQTGGNQTEAALALRTPRRTLVRKISALGLRRLGYVADPPGPEPPPGAAGDPAEAEDGVS